MASPVLMVHSLAVVSEEAKYLKLSERKLAKRYHTNWLRVKRRIIAAQAGLSSSPDAYMQKLKKLLLVTWFYNKLG
jgi:hypothetical protein